MRAWPVALVLVLTGCGRACKNDHPYVPYSIAEAGVTSAVEDAGTIAPAEDAAAPGTILATPAPANATRWSLDGLDLVAPADRTFVLGVTGDVDGDGAKDALAVVRAMHEPLSAAELVFFKGQGAASVVASAPVGAPDPACAPADRLAIVGHRSASVELGTSCKAPVTGSRWLAVVTFDRGARLHFDATIVDPPNAPKLTLDVDGSDRDGDGIDDVTVRATVDAPNAPFEPMPRASARLAWFDRPAGLSRDPQEPDASLRALAKEAMTRAGRAKDAPGVPAAVHQTRALYAALCSEAGAPRVTKVSVGNGSIACGASKALEEAGLALTRAWATLGDPVRAASALDRAPQPPATRTAARLTEAAGWITQSAPVVQARQLRAIAAVPHIERSAAPSWGALAFEPSGKLLVRTSAGVVRVDPTSGDEADAPDVHAWKVQVLSPDGQLRWIEAYSACDNVALHATFAPTADADPRDVLLPVAPALSARCAAGKGDPARAQPVAWGPRGLEAIVSGEPILFAPDLAKASLAAAWLDQPAPQGSPRSAGGKAIVVPTSQGIAVRSGKPRLLRAKELEGGYLELRDCAVSDDGVFVGCVRGGRAFVGAWDAP
jgi:hypothetical protein